MHVITLNTITGSTVTIVSENICSMTEHKDQVGTTIELVNNTEITVSESLLEITQQMQKSARI